MAEEAPQIDPAAEGRRIVSGYLNELGWAKEMMRMVVNQLIPAVQKAAKIEQAEEATSAADEHFGAEVDKWRADHTKLGRSVLKEIMKKMGKRSDLSYFGKRMMARIKEELQQGG